MFTCFLTLFRLRLRLREVLMSNSAFMKYVWFEISLLSVSLTHRALIERVLPGFCAPPWPKGLYDTFRHLDKNNMLNHTNFQVLQLF